MMIIKDPSRVKVGICDVFDKNKAGMTLQELVDNEDKQNPLTDEQLVSLMAEHGYSIARRTVAKYRDLLNIPVARLRKRI